MTTGKAPNIVLPVSAVSPIVWNGVRFTGRTPADPGAPQSAEDRRPGDVPFYIAPDCGTCGTALVPLDIFLAAGTTLPEGYEPWWDEFTCPVCLDGCVMDWTQAAYADMNQRVQKSTPGQYGERA